MKQDSSTKISISILKYYAFQEKIAHSLYAGLYLKKSLPSFSTNSFDLHHFYQFTLYLTTHIITYFIVVMCYDIYIYLYIYSL